MFGFVRFEMRADFNAAEAGLGVERMWKAFGRFFERRDGQSAKILNLDRRKMAGKWAIYRGRGGLGWPKN